MEKGGGEGSGEGTVWFGGCAGHGPARKKWGWRGEGGGGEGMVGAARCARYRRGRGMPGPKPRAPPQVKIERLGQFNLKGIQQAPQYRKKLNGFYLGLVDCLQRRLDHASVETGVLQQTYEIFDLKGLGEDWGGG